jgi:hypothetical protein
VRNVLISILILAFSNIAQSKVDCVKDHENIKYRDKIPPYLVGIWAPKEAKFRGQYIAEGFAIYLDGSGKGAAIDPYVGARISAKYNSKKMSFQYVTIENDGNKPFKVKGTYSTSGCVLTLKSEKAPIVLYRRFSAIESQLKVGLGIE